MLSFRNLNTVEDASQWAAGLEERWPERAAVKQHIVEQVAALPLAKLHLVELCPGTGSLAELLLAELPQLTYTGFDSSELLLSVAQTRLAPFGQRARLIQADLNGDSWLDHLPAAVQAIVSLQSLHDLGDESHVSRIYGLARRLLAPGGLFLNADLTVSSIEEQAQHPGRCPTPRHIELLRGHGYESVTCTLELGRFGCWVGFRG